MPSRKFEENRRWLKLTFWWVFTISHHQHWYNITLIFFIWCAIWWVATSSVLYVYFHNQLDLWFQNSEKWFPIITSNYKSFTPWKVNIFCLFLATVRHWISFNFPSLIIDNFHSGHERMTMSIFISLDWVYRLILSSLLIVLS